MNFYLILSYFKQEFICIVLNSNTSKYADSIPYQPILGHVVKK